MILTPDQARRMMGLSQEEVAEKLKLSKTAYRNKEKGRAPWKYSEAKQFAEIVNLPIDEIIFFEENVT